VDHQGERGQVIPGPAPKAGSGSTILLGVCGSIAAYKAAELASRLTQDGHEVLTVLTRGAVQFVSPLTFQTLTGQPVGTDLFAEAKGSKIEHIALARRARLVLIAPATADLIGKLAHGLADDLLTTTVLATTAPVLVAPAMNPAMWLNPVVQENLGALRARGFEIIEPAAGLLACGETGVGRMAEPADMLAAVAARLRAVASWTGRRVLVTAGPTREPLDGVRFISNPSSGRMGYAVARAAQRRGADVVLITGPTELPAPFGVELVRVTTGAEMRQAVIDRFDAAAVLVKTAAVTDYRPAVARPGKNKDAAWDVHLEKVPNILEELAPRRTTQVVVGFAAETGDPEVEGARKLAARGLNLVVANDVSEPGSGFSSAANRAIFIHADGRRERLPLLPKTELAERILDTVTLLLDRSTAESRTTL